MRLYGKPSQKMCNLTESVVSTCFSNYYSKFFIYYSTQRTAGSVPVSWFYWKFDSW